MKQPKILVRGATGKTGSAVVDQHLAKDVSGRLMFVLPCFAKVKLPVVQFRGFSKMTLSSLHAQTPRVILSGFSPVELH